MRHVSMTPQSAEPYYRERMRRRAERWFEIRKAQIEMEIANEQTAAILRHREAMLAAPMIKIAS